MEYKIIWAKDIGTAWRIRNNHPTTFYLLEKAPRSLLVLDSLNREGLESLKLKEYFNNKDYLLINIPKRYHDKIWNTDFKEYRINTLSLMEIMLIKQLIIDKQEKNMK